MRILLSAVACNPERGSEAHFGWNAVRALSREHDLTVIAHGNDRSALERAQSDGRLPATVRFFYARERPNWHRNRIISRLQSWADYRHWCRESLVIGRRLHEETPFDLVHHVTLSSWRIATPLWKLGIPLVWGPIGGAETFPLRFYPTLSLPSMAYEMLRSCLNLCGLLSPSVRACARNSAALIASNPETAKLLRKLCPTSDVQSSAFGVRRSFHLLSAAFFTEKQMEYFGQCVEGPAREGEPPREPLLPSVPSEFDVQSSTFDVPLVPPSELDIQRSIFDVRRARRSTLAAPLLLFSGGDIEGRKGIALALRALALLKQKDIPFHYHAGGIGPETVHLQKLADRLGITDSVTLGVPLHGPDYQRALREAHIYLLPSLRDSAGLTLMEAMLAGCVPIVADCGGPGLIVADGCGIRIPVTTPGRMVNEIAEALQHLCNTPEEYRQMSVTAAKHIAKEFSETAYIAAINGIYAQLI